MKLYIVTGKEQIDGNVFDWEPGAVRTTQDPRHPCTVYEHPLVAILMYGGQSWIPGQRLVFEVAPNDEPVRTGQIKCRVQSYTIVKEIDVPTITHEQVIEVAIRCVLPYSNTPEYAQWCEWAQFWLSGQDRTIEFADFIENTVAVKTHDGRGYTAQWFAVTAAGAAHNKMYPYHMTINAINAICAANHLSENKLDLISIAEQVCGKWEVKR